MTQLNLISRASLRVKSIVSRLERKDRAINRSGSDDSADTHKSAFSTFFDAPNGVVRDRRLLIEERIRRSRLNPEKILPKLKSKKSSTESLEKGGEEYENEKVGDTDINHHQNNNSNSKSNLSGNISTDTESVKEDKDDQASVVVEMKHYKTGFSMFAQVSPIYEHRESPSRTPIPEPIEPYHAFTEQYKIEKSKSTEERKVTSPNNLLETENGNGSLMNTQNEDEISVFSNGTTHTGLSYNNEQESIIPMSQLQLLSYEDAMTAAYTQHASLASMKDEIDFSVMTTFLVENGICDETTALQYGSVLVKSGIPKPEILQRRLLRDQELLLNLGLDEETSFRILSLFFTPEQIQEMNNSVEPTSIKSKYKFDILPSEVAVLYHRATQQNDEECTKYLMDLAYQGNPYAQGFLMRMYALGQGNIEKNPDQAQQLGQTVLPWLREIVASVEFSSGMHGVFAKYLLGVCYSEGLGTTKDQREAVNWYRQSAEQGYEAAQAYLAHCYYSGQGVVQDFQQATNWYRLSANQGYAAAQCNLGICYELGEGVEKNLEEAVKWFILASAQNDSKAQYNLGRCYEKSLGVEKDLKKSFYYYKLAADLGHPAAQFSLGLFYFTGNDATERNFEEAFYWFGRSAALGYALAQCKIGLCYEKGIGVEKSLTDAVYYYQLSADQGEASALYYLGFCYANGLGVEKNQDKAIEYYRKSAEKKGYAAAQNNLGYCYFSGLGVKKNYTEAVKLYKLSAQQGYPPAQYNMGFCYEKGIGVQKKTQEMLKWYRLASSQGQKKATAALERLHR